MTNKPTWETRFRDKFTNVMGKGSIYGEERFLSTDDPRDIENFIDDLLAEQRKEIIEKIEKAEMPGYQDEGAEHAHAGYVRALEDIINLINQD